MKRMFVLVGILLMPVLGFADTASAASCLEVKFCNKVAGTIDISQDGNVSYDADCWAKDSTLTLIADKSKSESITDGMKVSVYGTSVFGVTRHVTVDRAGTVVCKGTVGDFSCGYEDEDC